MAVHAAAQSICNALPARAFGNALRLYAPLATHCACTRLYNALRLHAPLQRAAPACAFTTRCLHAPLGRRWACTRL